MYTLNIYNAEWRFLIYKYNRILFLPKAFCLLFN